MDIKFAVRKRRKMAHVNGWNSKRTKNSKECRNPLNFQVINVQITASSFISKGRFAVFF
jgi:phosphoribosylaminoimidazole carboxylase (NCAIR synthetase)